MAGEDNRYKTMLVRDLLLEKTDPDHPITQLQIQEELRTRYQVDLNRKTVSSILQFLTERGRMDIRHNVHGYYVAERTFTMPELKLLVDTVQAAKFLTEDKSRQLIRKLEGLTSEHLSKELHREVFLFNRPKTENETAYNAVDGLFSAINNNRQVTFQYTQWNFRKELEVRRGGAYYQVSPWALTWSDENYYLIAYNPLHQEIRHYRVDKIKNLRILLQKRQGQDVFEHFDLAAYVKSTFNMYSGKVRRVTLRCENVLAGVMIDRFGRDVMLIPIGPNHFHVTVDVAISPQFFGWAAGIGPRMQIDSPEDVRSMFLQYLYSIFLPYQKMEEKKKKRNAGAEKPQDEEDEKGNESAGKETDERGGSRGKHEIKEQKRKKKAGEIGEIGK